MEQIKCSCCKKFKPADAFIAKQGLTPRRTKGCEDCRAYRRQVAKDSYAGTFVPKARGRPRLPLDQLKQQQCWLQRPEAVQYRQAQLEKQAGKCAICDKETSLNLDHCHLTGKFRGMLCTSCNTGLGFFKDNVENLRRAVSYLGEAFSP